MQEDALQIFYTGKSVSEFEYYAKMFKTIEDNGKGLMNLNVNRGNANNFGFVYEYNTASAENIKSLAMGDHVTYEVINNNGACDIIGSNSITQESTMYQLKAPSFSDKSIKRNIKVDSYPNQVMVTPLENCKAVKYVKESGGVSKRSLSTRAGAELRSDIGKLEAKVMKTKTAPIVGSIDLVRNQLMAASAAGINTSINAGVFAAAFSVGSHLMDLCDGSKAWDEILSDTLTDTVNAAKSGFVAGAVSYGVVAVASQSAVLMTIMNTTTSVIMSFGPISFLAAGSMGPLILAGVALGAGMCLLSGILRDRVVYKERFNREHALIQSELMAIKRIYNDLDSKILSYCGLTDRIFADGLNLILSSIQDDNFDTFVSGLEMTMSVFHKSVLFKNLEEFDAFFYDDNAILVF